MASEPPISFVPSALGFPEIPVGSMSEPRRAHLSNDAPWPIFMPEMQLRGDAASEFVVDAPVPQEIPAGGAVQVNVIFAPAAPAKRSADLTAIAEDGLGAQLFLEGLGHSPNSKPGETAHESTGKASEPKNSDEANHDVGMAAVQMGTTTKNVLMLEPWTIFEKYPKNTQQKKNAYVRLDKAKRALHTADRKLAAAQDDAAREAARKEREKATVEADAATAALRDLIIAQHWKADREGQQIKKEEARQLELVNTLEKQAKKDKSQELADKLRAARERLATLTRLKGEAYRTIEEAVEARMNLSVQERTIYRITVDGESVTLHNRINSYATTTPHGLDGDADSERQAGKLKLVMDRLDESNLSSSLKKILKTVSQNEGGFSTINTYDKAVLTWGFMQWTGGEHSDLTKVLQHVKKVAPDAFERRFQRYGIDVVSDKLIVTDTSGTKRQGKAAAKALQESPALTAVLSRAGLDAEIQRGQISAAVAFKIDKVLDHRVEIKKDGTAKKIRIGDVITSEYGVGLLTDHAVHGGEYGAMRAAATALRAYVAAHPDIDLDHPARWAGDAEEDIRDTVMAGWSDRAAVFIKNGCSKDPGSFRR